MVLASTPSGVKSHCGVRRAFTSSRGLACGVFLVTQRGFGFGERPTHQDICYRPRYCPPGRWRLERARNHEFWAWKARNLSAWAPRGMLG